MFSVGFECLLDYCSFMGKKMFIYSPMKNAVFTEANLSRAQFDRADLSEGDV
jgi:uncharacterized protein YjbI with pentapeptide repeats